MTRRSFNHAGWMTALASFSSSKRVCTLLLGTSFFMVGQIRAEVFEQSLNQFDIDPGSHSQDSLIALGPPVSKLGESLARLAVKPSMPVGLFGQSSLHVLSRSIQANSLDGPGMIAHSGPRSESIEVWVGEGPLPAVSGTAGLTRIDLEEPTPFNFTKGKNLFLYYIANQSPHPVTFGELFGDGDEPILRLFPGDDCSEPIPGPELLTAVDTAADREDTRPDPAETRPSSAGASAERVMTTGDSSEGASISPIDPIEPAFPEELQSDSSVVHEKGPAGKEDSVQTKRASRVRSEGPAPGIVTDKANRPARFGERLRAIFSSEKTAASGSARRKPPQPGSTANARRPIHSFRSRNPSSFASRRRISMSSRFRANRS